MWRSLWRSFDRFSLQYFKQVINELSEIKVVDQHNKELVVDLLQSIVELVTYGDKQDHMIFECFMENQVLAEFLRVLKISNNSRIEAPLLQYLSIMIQNLSSDQAIYYCYSNDYINNIILHEFEFNRGDLAQYYVSFLRAVSTKLNRDTLCLLVKVQADAVVLFPLFDEALKFAAHEEKLIRTAIRNLSLSIFDASDDVIFRYVTTPPASKYFTDLVLSLRDQCFDLDVLVNDSVDECTHTKQKQLFLQADKIVDELYYFKDIISTGESLLSKLVTENLLSILIFPALNPLLKLEQNNDPNLSASTSLYLISLLLQVIEVKGIINPVAGVILYPYTTSTVRDAIREFAAEGNNLLSSFSNHLNTLENNLSSLQSSIHPKRNGMSAFIDSESHSLLIQALFLLVVIAESKDLDHSLAPVIGLNGMKETDENFFSRYMDEILNALLKVLASQTGLSVLIKWHTGWFIRKLLIAQGKSLINGHTLEIFNTSYEQSREQLEKELDGCWFDHILDTFINEWKSCKTVLEESCQRKDPLFALELGFAQQTASDDKASHVDWQKMVDAVKDFVLHLQLKSYMSKESLVEHPILNPKLSPASGSGQTHASDVSTASFGSEVSLASGVPCKVAFSHAGIRDIYLIPVATGTSGRVLLVEKNPFRSQRGVVLAIAPLAGLSPQIDKDHPMWLHLRIREFDPKFAKNNNTNVQNPNLSNYVTDGKWTLGFQNAKDCDAARLLILEQTRKQRSGVEDLLSPLFHNDFLQVVSNGQAV